MDIAEDRFYNPKLPFTYTMYQIALVGLEFTNPSFETRMTISSQAVSCYKVKRVNIILYTYTGHEAMNKTSKKKTKKKLKRQKNNLKEVKPW